jgi:hypothetical protein
MGNNDALRQNPTDLHPIKNQLFANKEIQ